MNKYWLEDCQILFLIKDEIQDFFVTLSTDPRIYHILLYR